MNLRTWFLFLYQNVQQESTENIKAESGQMTEWKAREPENDSIWRTAIAPWFSSLESSIQQRLNKLLNVTWGQTEVSWGQNTFDTQWSIVSLDTFSCNGWPFAHNQLVFYSLLQSLYKGVFERSSAPAESIDRLYMALDFPGHGIWYGPYHMVHMNHMIWFEYRKQPFPYRFHQYEEQIFLSD